MSKIKIAVAGISGRVGSRVAALASEYPDLVLMGAVVRDLQHRSFEPGLNIALDASTVMKEADVLIDFSQPEGTLKYLSQIALMGKAAVIGTTGFDASALEKIKKYSASMPIMLESNFSMGIAAMKLGLSAGLKNTNGFSCAITETHRAGKKDSPSGTAKDLAEMLMPLLGDKPNITSYRMGEVPGEHTIQLANRYEVLEISHRVYSRDAFAAGALRAALWIKGRVPGLYRFTDVLNADR